MAEKVVQPTISQDSSAAKAAEDLNILMPNKTIPIGGENIEVKEYPFMVWLKLKPRCHGLVEDLAEFLDREDDILTDELLEFFENHFQFMTTLLCESIHQPVEFLEQLSDEEMNLLLMTWWVVNKHFFLKSANRLLRAKALKDQPSDGQTSFSNSSATATID